MRFAGAITLLSLLATPVATAVADEAAVRLEARAVALADGIGSGDNIGRIRVLGMLELPPVKSEGLRFSQLSGLAWDDDDQLLYALSDRGILFHLRPVFDNDTLVDLTLLRAVPLRELGSDEVLKGRRRDAEGMDILGGRNGRKRDAELIISFERYPRIVRYRPDGHAIAEEPLPATLRDREGYYSSNRGLEGVCADPELGVLTMPESPLNGERPGFNRIFDLKGASWLYPIEEEYRVSDLVCLGGRRVLVLERDFGRLLWRSAVRLRIATLSAKSAPPASVAVETVVLLDTGDGYRIDNFEGLAWHRGRRFFMISDDNDLFVQRTLLLYFELLDR